jgi:hypothetical protein
VAELRILPRPPVMGRILGFMAPMLPMPHASRCFQADAEPSMSDRAGLSYIDGSRA